MALDAGLFAQMGVKPRSMGDYRQELDAQAANALALKTGNLGYQNALQAQQDDASYRDAAKGFGTDQVANYNALMQRGLPKQAQALQATVLGNQKTQAEIGHLGSQTANQNAQAGKNAVDAAQAKLGYGQKVLQSANAPEQVAMLMSQAVQGGIYTQQEAASFLNDMPKDPTQFAQWRDQQAAQGMDIAKKMELAQREKESARTDARVRSEGAANRGVTMRGQDMTDSRTRETQSAALTKPFEVTGPDGAPVLVQQDKLGNIKPVEGFQPKGMGATKLTEAQGNATNFAARMKDASRVVDELEANGVSSSDFKTKAAGSEWTNWLASEDGQKYRQAQENWVTANLRKESGAAIGKDEMAKDIAKWFPKVGDTPGVRAQKAEARRVSEEGMLVQAGPGAKQVEGILSRSNAKPSQATTTPKNAKGWALHTDASGNKAYVSPDGKSFEEVK